MEKPAGNFVRRKEHMAYGLWPIAGPKEAGLSLSVLSAIRYQLLFPATSYKPLAIRSYPQRATIHRGKSRVPTNPQTVNGFAFTSCRLVQRGVRPHMSGPGQPAGCLTHAGSESLRGRHRYWSVGFPHNLRPWNQRTPILSESRRFLISSFGSVGTRTARSTDAKSSAKYCSR